MRSRVTCILKTLTSHQKTKTSHNARTQVLTAMKMIKMTLNSGEKLSTLLLPFSQDACPCKKCLIPKQLMLSCARKLT